MALPVRRAPHRGASSFILLLILAVAAGSGAGAGPLAQPETEAVQGIPMMLPDGRLAIFGAAGDRTVVLRVASVGAERPPLVDLQDGDVIIAFQGIDTPDSTAFTAALAGIPQGKALRFVVRRGSDEHDLEFPKPSSSFMIPQGATGGREKGTARGGWVTDPSSDGGANAGPGQTQAPPMDPSERASAIQRLLAEANTDNGPGMTLAVLHHGELAIAAERGLASLEMQAPLTSQTVLPVASVSKQFTAFAIALLASRGQLSLDDDIRKFLPELSSLPHTVKVRHLLTHTSGLKDYTGLLALTGWEYGDDLTAAELITLAGRQSALDFRPGTTHRYSNTNYGLLPVIVERIVGMGFQQWMQRELFAPLGMNRTSFPETSREIIPDNATLYRPVDTGFEQAHGGHGLAGPGGMMSTSVDLLQWAKELVSGELSGPAVMEMMRRPTVLEDGSEVGYGMGIGVSDFRGVPRLAHSGSGRGSASILHVYPEDDLAIAVLSNYGQAEVYRLAEQIAELYLGDRLGSEASESGSFPPGAFMITDEHVAGEGAGASAPIDPKIIASFAGRYVLDEDDRELMLEADGSTLLLKLGHQIDAVPLVHLGDGRFFFPPARWELTLDQTERPGQRIVLHLTEVSIHRGEDRDVAGYRSDVVQLTTAKLESFTGDYLSNELGIAYRILLHEGDLMLEYPRLGTLPLTHHSADSFGLPGRQVVRLLFRRADPDDPASPITGLTAEAFAWGASARFDRLAR